MIGQQRPLTQLYEGRTAHMKGVPSPNPISPPLHICCNGGGDGGIGNLHLHSLTLGGLLAAYMYVPIF